MKHHIAICIGHSRPGDNGALSHGRVTEHAYNLAVGIQLQSLLTQNGITSTLIPEYQGNTYATAMQWLAGKLKSLGVTLAIELHFNAANRKANGYEYLYWHTSTNGKRLALLFHKSHAFEFPRSRSRGIKPLTTISRGALFCRLPHCPSIILEPFFGDNPDEWETYANNTPKLAAAYHQALADYIST